MGFGAARDSGPTRALCKVSRAASMLARIANLRSERRWTMAAFDRVLDRAERALERIERALAEPPAARPVATKSFAPRCAKRSPSSTS